MSVASNPQITIINQELEPQKLFFESYFKNFKQSLKPFRKFIVDKNHSIKILRRLFKKANIISKMETLYTIDKHFQVVLTFKLDFPLRLTCNIFNALFVQVPSFEISCQ